MLDYRERPPRGENAPTISVILLDWKVRESFHSLTYLNKQTLPRDRVELIWVEFYDHRPSQIKEAFENPASGAAIDKWIVLGRSDETYYHKHEMYNAGLMAAAGEICIICDSDAIFAETFLHSVYLAFRNATNTVIHLDQVRSDNRAFYPFNYPRVADFLAAPGLINWVGRTTIGLAPTDDALHERNYGACMCARRRDLIEIGGADEHLDYLGYICGPHELTFRLVNAGRREKWLDHEWIYHTWHPGQAGGQNFGGPQDGRNFSTRTLDLLKNRRIRPWVENPLIDVLRRDDRTDRRALLTRLGEIDRTVWTTPKQHLHRLDPVQLLEVNVSGFNLMRFGDLCVALAQSEGAFVRERLWQRGYQSAFVARDPDTVKQAISYGPGSPYHISRVQLPEGLPAADADPVPVGVSIERGLTAWLNARVEGAPSAVAGTEAGARVRTQLALSYGRALYEAGEVGRALDAFQLALSSDPGNRAALKGRGNAHLETGRPRLALQDFEALLADTSPEHQPDRCEVLTGRAWAQYHLGHWPEAAADFSEALLLAGPSTPHALVRNIHLGRGWALARHGRRREAVEDFRRLRLMDQRQPANAASFWLLYRVNRLRGRLARVRRQLRARA